MTQPASSAAAPSSPPSSNRSSPPPSRVDHVALAPGAAIGRYVVRAVLGQGGFGITYRAHDTRLDREVAIKEYLPAALAIRHDGAGVLPRSTEAAADFGWGRDRFLAEARTLAGLHEAPAIVKVFDFLEANGTAYMVMERLRGRTLEECVRSDGPLDGVALDALLWPLLAGLQKVHEAGFLHRDIKPANIVVDDDGRATLIDFGASRAAMAGRTRTMTAIFTPGFAAPEQFSAARQGAWTDIYGLAATLHFALTGAAPPSAVDRLMEESYRPLAAAPPAGVAPALADGIDAGLALPIEQRPPDVAAWQALLQGAPPAGEATQVMPPAARLEAAARPVTPPTPPTPPSAATELAVKPPRSRRRAGWMTLAAVGVLALAGAAIGVWSSVGSPVEAPVAPTAGSPVAAPPTAGPPTAARSDARTAPPGPAGGAAPSRAARPPAAATTGHFAGALSGSASGGGAPSLAPVAVDLEAAAGTLTGRVTHPVCGTQPVILAVAADGTVSGRLRLWEATGCATNAATAAGRLAARSLTLDLRGVDVAYRGALSPVAQRAPDPPAPPSSRALP